MADVDKVDMLVMQCKKLLKDHPYDESDPMSYIVTLSLFHDELKFLIKALEQLRDIMEFDNIEVIK